MTDQTPTPAPAPTPTVLNLTTNLYGLAILVLGIALELLVGYKLVPPTCEPYATTLMGIGVAQIAARSVQHACTPPPDVPEDSLKPARVVTRGKP
jgi:hypothetical protein